MCVISYRINIIMLRGEDMRVEVTFKNNDKEKELYEFLESKGEIVGKSAYIKQLLLEQLKKENNNK